MTTPELRARPFHVTLFSEPGKLGYTRVDGPYPFGAAVRLPAPFALDIDTSGLVRATA